MNDLILHTAYNVHHENNGDGEDGASYYVLDGLGYVWEADLVEDNVDRDGELVREFSDLFLVKSHALELEWKHIAFDALRLVTLIEDEFAEAFNGSLAVELIPVASSQIEDSGEATHVIGSAKVGVFTQVAIDSAHGEDLSVTILFRELVKCRH